MTIIDTLIYDRTAADVALAKMLNGKGYAAMTKAEKTAWLAGLKGAYNATDLNRVETAVAYLSALLVQLPDDLKAYAASLGVAWDTYFDAPYDPGAYDDVDVKTDWSVSYEPTSADLARYLDNVRTIITALAADYPALPARMANLDHIGANAIEQALVLLYEAVEAFRAADQAAMDRTAAAWHYSGDVYAGEI